MDEVALSDPLSKSPLLESFPNTELPVWGLPKTVKDLKQLNSVEVC